MEYDWSYVEEFSGYEDGCDEQYYDEDEEQYEWEPQEHFEVRSDTDYEGEELQESCPPEALAHCSCRPGSDSDSSGRLRSESSHGSTSDWETDDGSAASHGGSHSSESDPCDCKSDSSCTCNDKEPSASSSSSSWETTSTCSYACCSAVAYAVRLTHIPARWDRPAQPTNKLMRSHRFSRKVVGEVADLAPLDPPFDSSQLRDPQRRRRFDMNHQRDWRRRSIPSRLGRQNADDFDGRNFDERRSQQTP